MSKSLMTVLFEELKTEQYNFPWTFCLELGGETLLPVKLAMSEKDAFGKLNTLNTSVKYVQQRAINPADHRQRAVSQVVHDEFVCVSAEHDFLDNQLLLSAQQAHHFVRYALWLSAVSLILSAVLGLSALVVGVKSRSDAAFGFGLNCALDFCSTLVVVWRFLPNAKDAGSWQRERQASIFIAFLFVLAFVAVVCKAIADLIRRRVPESSAFGLALACISVIVCFLLAWMKVALAGKLLSPSLRTDGVNSFAGGAIAVGVVISWAVVHSHQHVWYVDSFVALLVGLCMFVYAVRLLAIMMSPEALHTPVYKW